MAKAKWSQVGGIWKTEKKDGTKGKMISLQVPNIKGGKEGIQNLIGALEDLLESGDPKASIVLQMEKPADKLMRLQSLGYIEEDELEAKINNLPQKLMYELTLPPRD